MDKKAEKLKDIIKGKVQIKPTFGTDPNDPWSVKAGITEENLDENETLNKYLISKGLNPKTASKVSKIAASKTGEFEKWKQRRLRGGRLPEETIKEDHDAESLAKKHGVSVDSIEKQLKMGQEVEHEHTKDDAKALKIAKDHVAEIPDYYSKLKKMEHGKCDEDVYQDPKAATQTVFDGANNTNDTCSKGAKLIKSLYKKKIKEDLNDWEKEDKSVASYGKKAKLKELDPQRTSDDKPQAAAVLSGGTTLTGQSRDTLEIDPEMKRPIRFDKKK